MSVAFTDTDCRKRELSINREGAGLCLVCRGAGFVAGPSDYPNFENRSCCPHCETGRRLCEKIAEIVTRDVAEARSRRNAY